MNADTIQKIEKYISPSFILIVWLCFLLFSSSGPTVLTLLIALIFMYGFYFALLELKYKYLLSNEEKENCTQIDHKKMAGYSALFVVPFILFIILFIVSEYIKFPLASAILFMITKWFSGLIGFAIVSSLTYVAYIPVMENVKFC